MPVPTPRRLVVDLSQPERTPDGQPNPLRERHIDLTPRELQQREADAAAGVEHAWRDLRAHRDARLAACDWTMLPDAAVPAKTAAAWTTYRQQLRDLPANTKDPSMVTWPQPPG